MTQTVTLTVTVAWSAVAWMTRWQVSPSKCHWRSWGVTGSCWSPWRGGPSSCLCRTTQMEPLTASDCSESSSWSKFSLVSFYSRISLSLTLSLSLSLSLSFSLLLFILNIEVFFLPKNLIYQLLIIVFIVIIKSCNSFIKKIGVRINLVKILWQIYCFDFQGSTLMISCQSTNMQCIWCWNFAILKEIIVRKSSNFWIMLGFLKKTALNNMQLMVRHCTNFNCLMNNGSFLTQK